MAWNEPGDNNQDPWTGKDKKPNDSKKGESSGPNPEEIINTLNKKLGGLFGNSGSGGNKSGGDLGGVPGGFIGIAAILVVLLAFWLFSGFYTVDARQKGLVLQFGAYEETTSPGLHWHWPSPIETVEILDVDQNRSANDRSTMLTKDENIVDVEVSVQYKIDDPVAYAFNVYQADNQRDQAQGTLFQVMRSSIREIVGRNSMDFVLKEGRAQVAVETQDLIQSILNKYNTGLRIIKVNLTYAEAPEAVRDAFDDANRAREDANRFINEADTYAKKVVPAARGKAARLVEEANAYSQEVMAKAEGDASRFTQLVNEYKKSPEVTRERLYLETMESVMEGTRKVIIDSDNNNMMYLPLDGAAPRTNFVPPPAQSFNDSSAVSSQKRQTLSSNTRGSRDLTPGATRQGR